MPSHNGEYWIISVPNSLPPTDPSAKPDTWNNLKAILKDVAEVNQFDIPELRSGTLDRLMRAADHLGKLDPATEQVVRKVERQYRDLVDLSESSGDSDILEVDDVPTLQYLETFAWNSAKYPVGRHIDETIKSITNQTVKLEQELKESGAFLSEKKQLVSNLQRKAHGNLSVVALDTILTPDVIIENDLVQSDYIKDVAILVQKTNERGFLQEYELLASKAVDYNKDKESKVEELGSPIVPASAVKITDDAEYSLYTVKILKNYASQVKKDALAKRYIMKEIDFSVLKKDNDDFKFTDPRQQKKNEQAAESQSLEQATEELNTAVAQMKRWCQANYGEAFAAWVHVKAIRVFVESALRYGIPANFAAALVSVEKISIKSKARKILFERFKQLDESGMMATQKDEAGLDELFPYVSFDISAFGNKS